MTVGYSGTPLAKKLGLKPGMRAWSLGLPDSVRTEIDREAQNADWLDQPEPPVDLAIFSSPAAPRSIAS